MRAAVLPCVHGRVSATSCARIVAQPRPSGPLRAADSRVPRLRVCSKLCSDRVDNPQVGTRRDRIGIRTFSARTREVRRDSREADRPKTGLANHRLQPLGHLTAARKLSINEIVTYATADCPSIVPKIVPASPERVATNSDAPSARRTDLNAAVLFADNYAGN